MHTRWVFGKIFSLSGFVLVPVAAGAFGVGYLQAGTIAYQVPYGTNGNQAFSGPFGMDFNVQGTILVTHLGVFDDGSNGLNRDLTAYIYNRTATSTPVVSLQFPTTDQGQLIGGSRFKPLPNPIYLPFGFQGSIVAENYGTGERNGNSGGATPVWTTDSGGGALAFVGGGRYGAVQGQYPPNPDGGPANRYAAGTFIFERAPIAYDVKLGTVGNQTFTGALGMDFRTNRPLVITHLGAFDSGGDGISGTLAVKVYARTKNNTDGLLLTSLSFSGTDGQLIGGSRFLPLSTPLVLPGGFDGSIVMEVNPSNPNGNTHGAAPTNWITYDGGGALSFVGSGRFTTNPAAYPTNLDGGPANRYAAGSFMFAPFDPYGQASSAFAIGVAVENFSFELPPLSPGGWTNSVPGWAVTGSAGAFRPTTTQFPSGVPDGQQIAFVNPGGVLTATLGETLQPDTLYILQVDWGRRQDGPAQGHQMTLRAGGVDLGWVNNSTIGNGPMPPVGGWSTAWGYFTANHNAPIGSAVQIQLLPVGTPNQSNYDNVRLWKLSGAALLVNNPSFEMDDVPEGGYQQGAFGWVQSGDAGVYQGASEITPADGQQSAYVTGGANLTQTLAGVPLRNDYVYILMVDVADRRSTTFAGYQVELLAGGQTLAIDNNSLGVIQATDTAGYFYTTAVVTFRGINHPLAGQVLGIRLTALGDASNQTYFDNVRLFAYWVPEPSSWTLLAVAGGLLLAGWGRRFRRNDRGVFSPKTGTSCTRLPCYRNFILGGFFLAGSRLWAIPLY